MNRAIEVRDLAAQIIDPFGRCDRAREDGAFDLFDVGFEVGDDRAVALDHLVQDCPEHRVSAKCKQFGVLFEPRARAVQLTGDTLSNRNDETRSDEDADLAEIDLVLVMVVMCGAQDDQLYPGFVFLDLWAQVKGLGVLDGKLVQTERFPDLVELIAAGLEHAQPYEPALMTLHCSLIQLDRPVALTATVEIVSAVDNHRRPPIEQRRTQLLATFNPAKHRATRSVWFTTCDRRRTGPSSCEPGGRACLMRSSRVSRSRRRVQGAGRRDTPRWARFRRRSEHRNAVKIVRAPS